MLRRIEKVLEQVRQTTCGDVFRSTKGRCKNIFFPERYTVNKENGDCQYIYMYELKKEGILLSVETRMSIFRVKLILFALLVTYLCASCTAIGLSWTSFIDMRYIKGKRSFVTVPLISIGNLAGVVNLKRGIERAVPIENHRLRSLIIIVSMRFLGMYRFALVSSAHAAKNNLSRHTD